MQILGLFVLGMYINAAVVFVKKTSLLFRLALAILWSRVHIDQDVIDGPQCSCTSEKRQKILSVLTDSKGLISSEFLMTVYYQLKKDREIIDLENI